MPTEQEERDARAAAAAEAAAERERLRVVGVPTGPALAAEREKQKALDRLTDQKKVEEQEIARLEKERKEQGGEALSQKELDKARMKMRAVGPPVSALPGDAGVIARINEFLARAIAADTIEDAKANATHAKDAAAALVGAPVEPKAPTAPATPAATTFGR